MTWFEVLVEGHADVPVIKEILVRKFKLEEKRHFQIHPHSGKGKLPLNPLERPQPNHRELLSQLPAKLRAYASSLGAGSVVLVVVDADDTPAEKLLADLNAMLNKLPRRPDRVLFRLAVEETESWFIADSRAVLKAFPKAEVSSLKKIQPDAVVDAWKRLRDAIDPSRSSKDKRRWAELIAPHLNLDNPPSPSLKHLIAGVAHELKAAEP